MDILGSGELIFSTDADVQTLRGMAMRYRSPATFRANNLTFDEWVKRMQAMMVETTFRGEFGDPTSAGELDFVMNEAESSTIEVRNLQEMQVEDDPDPERDKRTKRFYRYIASMGETVYILPPKWTAAVLLGSYIISHSLEDARERLAISMLVDHLKVGDEQQQKDVEMEVSIHRRAAIEYGYAAQIYEQLVEYYHLSTRNYR